MTFTPLKQTDSRWGYLFLGLSGLTIGDYGCTLTCCSMAANTTPDIAVKKASFDKNGCIIWESLIAIGLKLIKRERNKWDNNEVLEAIKKYGFCLGELVHPSGYIHWVFMIGNKKMIDPLSGKVEPVSKYENYIGYCILENINQEDNMLDALQECLIQHANLVDELTDLKEEHAKCPEKLKVAQQYGDDAQGLLNTCIKSKEQMISRTDYNALKEENEALAILAKPTPEDEKLIKLIVYLGLSGGLGYLSARYIVNDPALTVAFAPAINIILYALEERIGLLKKIVGIGRSE